MSTDVPPPPRGAILRTVFRVVLVLVLVYGLHLLIEWVMLQIDEMDSQIRGMLTLGVILFILFAYALLIAVPFVPGIEIALSLFVIRGPEIAPFVYVATFLGLGIAFVAGRFIPYPWLHRAFQDLHMTSACRLLESLHTLPRPELLARMQRSLPKAVAALITDYRYLTLAALINLPGNSLIGGGGGLMMAAGFSRLYDARVTALTIALAIAPVPLAVWYFGIDILG